MKRITVEITVEDDYIPMHDQKKMKAAIVNSCVQQATVLGLSIMQINARVGTVRKVK